MNEDLAAVHAYLCADGYVIKNPLTQKQKYYMIGLRNTNLILLKDFQIRFEKVFGVKPYLIEGQRCRIGSKEIYEKLTNQFGSFYSWDWRMPKDLDENSLKIWLRAYFDCEGWVTCKSHQNRMIGADCVNEMGINQIKKSLKRLHIDSKITKRNTRKIFSLAIFGRENLIRFREKIGFLHPEKNIKLNQVINDFVDYGWKFPNNENMANFIKETIKSRAKIKKPSGSLRIISKLEKNLLLLQKELSKLFGINSIVNRRINGIGTIYYELSINKKQEVKYLIDYDLINKEQKEKWLSLKE